MTLLDQAIERTRREAENPWQVWGLRSWNQLSGSCGLFRPNQLRREAQMRLEVLNTLRVKQ